MRIELRAGQLTCLNTHGLAMTAVPWHAVAEDVVASRVAAWLDAAEAEGELAPAWDGGRLDLGEVVSWMMMAEGLRPGPRYA
jgi:hypothetical protein